MKHIPWKKIAIGSAILTVLIVARGAVTVGRARYYGGDWLAELREDAWMYVGLAALAIAAVSWVMSQGKAPAAPQTPVDAETEENNP